MSEAGYCLIEHAALIAAPEEIALRVLARSVNAVSGRESPLQLAKLESLLEGLSENPKAAHTLGGCRLQPLGGRLGVFRETRGTGLPSLRLAPGERALWDNRFAVDSKYAHRSASAALQARSGRAPPAARDGR
jgi:tRNA(Ile)-lysidine synthase